MNTTVPLPLFSRVGTIALTEEISALLANHAPVAIGVSGGKDSTAAAFSTVEYLDQIGHRGPRVLIHSDLGVTEWPQSIEWCRKLSTRLELELMVVARAKGDMMDRWEQRWSDNLARYIALKCVKLILPWSTPDMRFCTSEMKVDVICRALSNRFPGQQIVSVTGIRRQESDGRKNAPIAKPQPKLSSVKRQTSGMDWHPIVEWSLADVFKLHDDRAFPLHPAYTEWGVSRVSCMDCIMQSDADARAVARNPQSHVLHRRIVGLEIVSTFGFQGNKWRADVAPELLDERTLHAVERSKERAKERQRAESAIPKHLWFTKGWPHCVPTLVEARILADVRRIVAQTIGVEIQYATPTAIISRYEELMAANKLRRKAA